MPGLLLPSTARPRAPGPAAPLAFIPRRLLPLAAALLFGLLACSDGPSSDQCEELLSHIVEIEVKAAAADAPGGARDDDIDTQKAEIEEYLGEEFIEICRDEYTRERIACALEADSYEALVDCDES